jgi:hypothetical protein
MNWDKIFSLIERTGGSHFIIDKNEEKVLVVMPMEEYEKHVSECLCEDDFVDQNDLFIPEAEEKEVVSEDEKGDAAAEPKSEEQFYIEPLE